MPPAAPSVLITGSANGIGHATAHHFNTHGCITILSDLPATQHSTEALITETFPYPENALFIAADVTSWTQMTALFETAIQRFGGLDIVVANAGIMEESPVLDLEDVDEEGRLRERRSKEGWRIMEVNLGGVFNTLRLAMFHMKNNESSNSKREEISPSIVLVTSTSGYFGGTGVTAYVASKHGVVGLLRASQEVARRYGIRVNAVAPFLTPTSMTAGFAQRWQQAGLETNSPGRVAEVIAQVAQDSSRRGECVLVSGKYTREMESTRTALLPSWLGEDIAGFMARAMQFFSDIGGYVLPRRR
ncbi:short chain dehydrogenase/reductase [Aspergillus ellipticus CBS 707.79]|uniref:Short chain dehydrogenase/reductase n=1 Tax=Aspergillus ellipticus CBS 707.79 TaxID=1448320 RepID=A0A319DKI0_9EURO|nr:short chain dehydrogenase/reductase [Aspergillus ellipticus CBS 707.79]